MYEPSEKKPIRRDEFLKPLSRDHHEGLLFCWKIKTGLQKNISLERLEAFAKYFFINELLPHFKAEEKEVFPLLGNEHELVQRALFEHRQLKELFSEHHMTLQTFTEMMAQLNYHIRFEERILFQAIQDLLREKGRDGADLSHQHTTPPLYIDPFWEA